MFSLAGIMLFLALIIPPILNEIVGQSTSYDIDALSQNLSQTDRSLTSFTSISTVESIFSMFFWVYSGVGVFVNSILILFKVTFWWLIIKLIRGTG